MNKRIHIISGGTISHIATHLALCAPAFGSTGTELAQLCEELCPDLDIFMHETRMATGSYNVSDLITNEDIADLIEEIKASPEAKIVFMPVALCRHTVNDSGVVVPIQVKLDTGHLYSVGFCKNGDGRKFLVDNGFDLVFTATSSGYSVVSKIDTYYLGVDRFKALRELVSMVHKENDV